jgi:adenylate cyclase
MEEAKKILIVDDSDLVAGILTEALSEENYHLVRAANGVEGVVAAYREIPDLIIMDVEMPLMQGYQASRLIKNRRGVKEIPIIMHTSLSDDKDKYWALSSGADAFVTKDFDNVEYLKKTVRKLIDHPPYQAIETIRDDGENIDNEKVFEMIGSLFDVQLFRSTVLNMLGELGRSLGSLDETAKGILELLPKVCESHIAVLMIKYQKEGKLYVRPAENVFRSDADDFLKFCFNDFYEHFSTINIEELEPALFGIDNREDYNKIRLDNKQISSYFYWPLIGKGGNVVGTLHIGNFSNNYFSERISENIRIFTEGSGTIMENAILFGQINEMHTKIRHVFSKFVPKEIIDDLIEKRSDEALLVGEKRNIVVLFSDIRSFTTISENNTAEGVVSFLNDHFSIMVDIIRKHGGSIDKFIGDAIFAIFGAPVSYEDNALRAARAAVEMTTAMDRVHTGNLVLPDTGYAIGIGLHEGEAIVGNIGSSDKFDYTAIGDTVNIASRLEGLTKHYHKKILVSEDIAHKLREEFTVREVDRVKVKGKMDATSLFSLEEGESALPPEAMDNFIKAMKLYKQGNWDTALDYFRQVKKLAPEDWLAQFYIDRCTEFKENPPENWDGSIALDFK